ncbi:MAG: hypothetical protein ACI8QN_001256 [Porticoccaceae bacterium]|jgi:hypothetical protein|tara:strand:- start:75 stop:209 length:135 start_codon:yes stop_codon:yes gene_type:complete
MYRKFKFSSTAKSKGAGAAVNDTGAGFGGAGDYAISNGNVASVR